MTAALPSLDHVVIAVEDLDRAMEDYRAAGFTVVPGGRHPGRNTRNALVVFEDGAYLELIAYGAPSPQERWWRELDAHGAGLVDFALLPQDIAAMAAAARGRGLEGLVERPGRRSRPDGVEIAWQSARPSSSDLPFLCADLTPRSLRVPEGEARRHPNGVTGIVEVRVAVRDLAATLARYAALLGVGPVEGQAVSLQGFRITFEVDRQRLRDEGPCAVILRSGLGEGSVQPLDVPPLR